MQVSHPITRFEIMLTRTNPQHHTRRFNAQTSGELGHRIAATAVLDIDVIDPNPHMLNQNLMGLGLWAVL
jgi:hypothetical protein